MKLFSLSLSALLLAAMFTSCGNDDDGSGYIIKKTTDGETLNLKGAVEEYIEQDLVRYGAGRRYTKFNEQGYIVEMGSWTIKD